ncbi:MAG: preprotein translocase subunit SecA, partial [Acidimicrobiales bacterium]
MTVSLSSLLRSGGGRRRRALRSLVPAFNALEPSMESLSDEVLRSKTIEFRQRLANAGPRAGEDVAAGMLAEAFAVVREASRRVLGLRHHDVQLMGGAALYLGWVAEMRTGEGKTLVAALPSYLHALAGGGVHVVTVNDYLARRDADHVGRVHRWLGLDVGLVSPAQSDRAAKRAAYRCAITYGTPTEFGFDYLRDNLAPSADSQVQRGHDYALVDEADSVLIDEARTPLVISAPSLDDIETYRLLATVVAPMQRDVHYDVDEESRAVWPTELGVAAAEAALGIENLYDSSSAGYPHFLRAALRAKELYRRDRDYVVVDGQIRVVDESTGRILEGRRWAEGLHQAVEAKERVAV